MRIVLLPLAIFFAGLTVLGLATTSAAQSSTSTTLVISTVVGEGTAGYSGDGGPAIDAMLNSPRSVALDAQGNLYIADTNNNRVRRVTPGGTISTYAGNGTWGYSGDGGPATSAQLHSPMGLAVDSSGNLYIADYGNRVIREVVPNGTITTFAGDGLNIGFSCQSGLPASQYEFIAPEVLALDSEGNLYIGDFDCGISVVNLTGTSVVNNIIVNNYGLIAVEALAVDPSGNLYIAGINTLINNLPTDTEVRKVTPGGVETIYAGNSTTGYSGDGGPATSALLNNPTGLALDSLGNLYIEDSGNSVIRVVTPSGTITTYAGHGLPGYLGDGGPATNAELKLSYPGNMVADPSGNLYIVDAGNNAIRYVTTSNAPQVAEPSFTPKGGIYYNGPQTVTISDPTPGSTIHYTLDGTTPTASSAAYSGPIPVSQTTTIKVIAMAAGYINSYQEARSYIFPEPIAPVPTFSPAPGKYIGSVTVTLSDAIPGPVIRYTLDGTTPVASSPTYTGPFTLTARTTTVKAIATQTGYWKSPVVAAQYSVLPQAPAPVFSPGPGEYAPGQLVTISDGIPTATIRYTTDGTTPTTASTLYTKPVALAATEELQAIAIATGDSESTVTSEQYTIVTPEPAFSLNPGLEPVGSLIALSDSISTASIYYTTDGTIPTLSSTLYTSPIVLTKTMVVHAIAIAPPDIESAVASRRYIAILPPTGIISTIAGDGKYGYSGDGGPALDAMLSNPGVVAVDGMGNLYLADSGDADNRIRVVNSAGAIHAFAGDGQIGYSGDGGPATSAELSLAWGIAFDSQGNLYFSDYYNHVVREVDTAGTITTVVGNGSNGYSGDGGQPIDAELGNPAGLAFDAAGNLYIADQEFFVVRKVTLGSAISTFAGNGKTGDSGDGGPAIDAELSFPNGLAFDSKGNLYIDIPGAGEIPNSGFAVVRKVTPSGIISTYAGNGLTGYSGDGGPATSAEMEDPETLAFDSSDNLYIVDFGASVVRMVNTSGIIITFAGDGVLGFSGDGGPANTAELQRPWGVAVDGSGNVYISDQTNQRVRKVVPIAPQ